MPTPAYLTIEGETQGLITAGTFTEESVGNSWQQGHEDEIIVQAYESNIHVPTDLQSGRPTAQRVHECFIITKVFDKSSPKLYRALTSGERLPKCELKWYRTSPAGAQEHYFSQILEDAIITKIKSYMPNCQDPNNGTFTHLEDVTFTYRKITWKHEVCGTEAEDDWRLPVAA